MLCVLKVSPRVRINSVRHMDRVGQLRMCHSVSVRWMHAGHLSWAALLVRCMCRRVGRCSCANLTMKIWALFSSVLSALPGTSQLIESKVCCDQLFLSMSLLQSLGLLAAFLSRWANRLVIVSPLMLRLALDAGMNGTSLERTE